MQDCCYMVPNFIMMTSSNGNIFRVTGPLWGEFTGHRWIHHTKASDAELWYFLWSAPWINGWVNTREAGDMRRYPAHCYVTVMAWDDFIQILYGWFTCTDAILHFTLPIPLKLPWILILKGDLRNIHSNVAGIALQIFGMDHIDPPQRKGNYTMWIFYGKIALGIHKVHV